MGLFKKLYLSGQFWVITPVGINGLTGKGTHSYKINYYTNLHFQYSGLGALQKCSGGS